MESKNQTKDEPDVLQGAQWSPEEKKKLQAIACGVNPRRNFAKERAIAFMIAAVNEALADPDMKVEFCDDGKKVVVCRVEETHLCERYLMKLGKKGTPKKDKAVPMVMIPEQVVNYGMAKCNEGDTFIRVVGRFLALCRATGESVPAFVAAVIHGTQCSCKKESA